MNCLIIETSTDKGLLAYKKGEALVFSKEIASGLHQSRDLMPAIAESFEEYKIEFREIDYIALGVGPGSYTGIRIAAATAKGLAYGWNVPIVEVCSLDGFVPSEQEGIFAAIVDARIGGLYIRIGEKRGEHIHFTSEAQNVTWEEAKSKLAPVDHFVTPSMKLLKDKHAQLFPEKNVSWEERTPSPYFYGGKVSPNRKKEAGDVELLYMRKTEAERNLQS